MKVTYTLYTGVNCSKCEEAKQYLKDIKVEFDIIDITDNEEARNKVVEETGFLSVPVLVQKKVLMGFHKDFYDAELS